MALTLRDAIDSDQTQILVNGADAIEVGDLFAIGSETVSVFGLGDGKVHTRPLGYRVIDVRRGQFGTNKASHAAATAMTVATVGGGEGTPLPYIDPTTSTPEAIVDAMIAGGKMDGPP